MYCRLIINVYRRSHTLALLAVGGGSSNMSSMRDDGVTHGVRQPTHLVTHTRSNNEGCHRRSRA